MDFLLDFFKNNFDNCIWLAVILIAACPIFESRISIPFALNSAIWGTKVLSPLNAFLLSLLGSIIPAFFIIIFSKKLRNKTTGFITHSLSNQYSKKIYMIENNQNPIKKYFLLTCFVSIPLPLTGVWSGSFIAGLSSLKVFYSFLSIFLGSAISAGAITLLCTTFSNSIMNIFIITLILIIVFLFISLFNSFFNKFKKNKLKN